MIAIQALNPDAFADGNINRLLSGQILRLPTEQEIRAIDAAEALVEVGQQNRDMTEVEPFIVPGQTDSEMSRPSGRLSVVASDSDATDASSMAPPASQEDAELDRRIAELESELSVRQEEATRARVDRENLDLRLADLDAQIEAAQELIRLQDIRLAQLRESLRWLQQLLKPRQRRKRRVALRMIKLPQHRRRQPVCWQFSRVIQSCYLAVLALSLRYWSGSCSAGTDRLC